MPFRWKRRATKESESQFCPAISFIFLLLLRTVFDSGESLSSTFPKRHSWINEFLENWPPSKPAQVHVFNNNNNWRPLSASAQWPKAVAAASVGQTRLGCMEWSLFLYMTRWFLELRHFIIGRRRGSDGLCWKQHKAARQSVSHLLFIIIIIIRRYEHHE